MAAQIDLGELVGESPAIESVRRDLRRLLALVREGRRLPAILIQGETGTGKGLVAKLLHRYGPRSRGPFVDLNCAAIPETLLEGELFGYERGAFTDARRAKPGLFQTSNGGMLLLDEVALLPESLQAKLLTAIEEHAVRRLGATSKEPFDTWLVSATNVDLEHAVRQHHFREDLYHRLAVLTVRLPPLRERPGDAALLVESFLEQAARHYGLTVKSITREAMARVARDPWRGNVRELANVAERLALLCDGPEVTAADFDAVRRSETPSAAPAPTRAAPAAPPALAAAAPGAPGDERARLVAALEATGWNIMRTGTMLGLSRNTVRARMDRYGLRTRTAPAPAADAPAAPPPEPAPTTSTVRWERRHVTLLRVAIAAPGDAAMHAGRVVTLAAEKVRGFGGRLEGLGRTRLDASFGVLPIENAARRAASAALSLHKSVAELGQPELSVSTVLHTAQATVGQVGDSLVVEDADRQSLVTELADLLGRAPAGQVRASASTAPFLERHFELRGDDAATTAVTVIGPDPSGLGAWRRLTRFVGRDAEMDTLRTCWELARAGRGQVVGLVGEPGVGKSRLLLEFTRALDPAAVHVVRIAAGTAQDPSRPRPAAALLRALFAIAPGDRDNVVRDKLVAGLAALGLDPDLVPPLSALLDLDADDGAWQRLDPQLRARRMLDAVQHVVVRESRDRVVVLALDDLHWVDPDTRAVADRLVDAVPTSRILLIAAYRPEYRHGWADKTCYTQLRIDTLPVPAAAELLEHLLGAGPDTERITGPILAWTEGNPFFLEEAVRTLVETGRVGAPAGGDPARLPATVEDTLAARLHRLPPETRHVLQCAAAIGIECPRAVLGAVAGLPEEALTAHLRVLESAEFVHPLVGMPTARHRFKHALTHLVTYRSLPPDRQRALHGLALDALEALPDTPVEALAEHAFRAERWEQAAAHLHAAGTRALARSATQTAEEHLTRAIGALAHAGRRRDLLERAIDVRLDLRYALALLGQYARTLPHLREAEALAAELDDTARLGRVVSFLANGLYLVGDYEGALAAARRAAEIGRRLDDAATRVRAGIYAGRTLHALGKYREAAELFGAVIDDLGGERRAESAGLPVLPAAYARSYLVMVLVELGEFSTALTVALEALAIAEATEHRDTIQWACYALGLTLLDQGDADAAIAPLERALAICTAAELPVYVPRATAALGHAQVLAGRPGGIALLEAAAAAGEGPDQWNQQAGFLSRLADGYARNAKPAEATSAAIHALALARERGERGSEAHALYALAGAAETDGRLAESGAGFEAARALAGALGMRPLAAHCRLGLGRLARAAGRATDARAHLDAAREAFRHLAMGAWARAAETELDLLG